MFYECSNNAWEAAVGIPAFSEGGDNVAWNTDVKNQGNFVRELTLGIPMFRSRGGTVKGAAWNTAF